MLQSAMDFLHNFSLPIAHQFSLTRLPEHFPTLVGAFVFFQLLEWTAPVFLRRLSPIHFGQANARTQLNWSIRVVSTVHALVIIAMAVACMNSPELEKDKAFAFNERVGRMTAVACGFLWDLIDSIVHYTTIGFVIHGAACLTVYSQAFRPFLGYYGCRFLLWELSTPFLNAHWFLDKTNKTGSTFQVVNGIVLLATFFFARICYGSFMSYRFFQTLQEVRSELPTSVALAYAIGNISLQSLNWFWFYKMVHSLQKRFRPKTQSPTKDNGYPSADGRKME
ncbi:hypothetical protein M422DRAFT_782436 [Sphaerobolus stellatus SS14]|uniref:TLC domain-containing protein n=1 Tax=Sphaerobolus stellatus (strain SS14) TaxID=990650 RepID=A0A0C9VEB0_SPHS4|nr:hypothetical protein M422DRAFT_782436 [Sphaerobolus stellatus SS14]